MHKKLKEILRLTRVNLESRKRTCSLSLLAAASPRVPVRHFVNAVRMENSVLSVIAELKLASPSAGVLGNVKSILSRACAYELGGACALSIVTEPNFFKGDTVFVRKVKALVSLPILQKDFVVDPYQVYEARNAGADALLLIARLLSRSNLALLVNEVRRAGLEPVVEVHSEEDLRKARATTTGVIAVNARDLDTFSVDLSKACALLKRVPQSFVRLGFSGILTPQDARDYKEAGADAVLIGTALMKSKHPERDIATYVV